MINYDDLLQTFAEEAVTYSMETSMERADGLSTGWIEAFRYVLEIDTELWNKVRLIANKVLECDGIEDRIRISGEVYNLLRGVNA